MGRKKDPNKRVQVGISLPPFIVDYLKGIAQFDGKSLSSVVASIVVHNTIQEAAATDAARAWTLDCFLTDKD